MHSRSRLPLASRAVRTVSCSPQDRRQRRLCVNQFQQHYNTLPLRRFSNKRDSSRRRNNACHRSCALACIPLALMAVQSTVPSSSQWHQERSTQRSQAGPHALAWSGEEQQGSRGGCMILLWNVARGQAIHRHVAMPLQRGR